MSALLEAERAVVDDAMVIGCRRDGSSDEMPTYGTGARSTCRDVAPRPVDRTRQWCGGCLFADALDTLRIALATEDAREVADRRALEAAHHMSEALRYVDKHGEGHGVDPMTEWPGLRAALTAVTAALAEKEEDA